MLWERGKRYNKIVQNLKYVDDTVLALGISNVGVVITRSQRLCAYSYKRHQISSHYIYIAVKYTTIHE